MGLYDKLKQEFIQYSDPCSCKYLYEVTKEVTNITGSNTQKLIAQMKEKLPKYSTGMAANQIGEPYQVFILEYHQENI